MIVVGLLLSIFVSAIVNTVMHGEYERALTLVGCLCGGLFGSAMGFLLFGRWAG